MVRTAVRRDLISKAEQGEEDKTNPDRTGRGRKDTPLRRAESNHVEEDSGTDSATSTKSEAEESLPQHISSLWPFLVERTGIFRLDGSGS